MKGDPKVIDFLNRYLSIELTGHKQYLLHSRLCGRWGYRRLKETQDNYSNEEWVHIGRLAERILFLEGKLGLQDDRAVEETSGVEAQFELDRALIAHACGVLREAVGYCLGHGDPVSEALFREMLVDEEEHIHWVETQLDLIRKVGLQNYLCEQMRPLQPGPSQPA